MPPKAHFDGRRGLFAKIIKEKLSIYVETKDKQLTILCTGELDNDQTVGKRQPKYQLTTNRNFFLE